MRLSERGGSGGRRMRTLRPVELERSSRVGRRGGMPILGPTLGEVGREDGRWKKAGRREGRWDGWVELPPEELGSSEAGELGGSSGAGSAKVRASLPATSRHSEPSNQSRLGWHSRWNSTPRNHLPAAAL